MQMGPGNLGSRPTWLSVIFGLLNWAGCCEDAFEDSEYVAFSSLVWSIAASASNC